VDVELAQENIIAVGLLTNSDLQRLGSSFARCYPIDDNRYFNELLAAIDEADRALRRDRQDNGA